MQRLQNLLSRLSIGARTLGLATLGVAVLVGMGAVNATVGAALSQAPIMAVRFKKVADHGAALGVAMLELRRLERDFFRDRQPDGPARVEEQTGKVESALPQLATLPDAAPVAAETARIAEGIHSYRAAFETAADLSRTQGVSEADGLRGTLNEAVGKAEAIVDRMKLDRFGVLILRMRLAEKEFMINAGDGALKRFRAGVSGFESALLDVDLGVAMQAEVINLVGDYGRQMLLFACAEGDLREQERRLQAELAPLIARIETFGDDGRRRAGAEAEATRDSLRRGTWTAVAVILAAVVALGVATARSISAPIARLTATMQRLAAGDGAVEVPFTGQRNAIENARLTAEREREQTRRLERARNAVLLGTLALASVIGHSSSP